MGTLQKHTSITVVEYIGCPLASRESACDALANWAVTVPTSATRVRLLGIPCLQQAALQQLLERCPRLEALEMPAAEEPTAEPLCPAEHGSTQLVAQRLSRPTGAWALQQLPVSLTQLCLSECGSLHPSSLMHLRGLTALTRLSIRGLRVPPAALPGPPRSVAGMTSVATPASHVAAPGLQGTLGACGDRKEDQLREAGGSNAKASAAGGDGGGDGAAAGTLETEQPCCPVVSSLEHWSRLTRLQDVEMAGQAGDDPGDQWDDLLPAFLSSLRHLTRLAFHPPALGDTAAALSPLALAPSLARLELGGCGKVPLQLHEATWRAIAAVPTLEQLLVGHCDTKVGSALAAARGSAADAIGLTAPTAVASVGLAAAASLSGWTGWGTSVGFGGSDGGAGEWRSSSWMMGVGNSRRGGACQSTGDGYGNPSTPEGSPIRGKARGAGAWLHSGGGASDGLLGVGLSDLQPIHEWTWDRDCAAATAAVQASPASATGWGSGAGAAAGTPASDLSVSRFDGWEAGVQLLRGPVPEISPDTPWLSPGPGDAARELGRAGLGADDVTVPARVGSEGAPPGISALDVVVAWEVAVAELGSGAGACAAGEERAAAEPREGAGKQGAQDGDPADRTPGCRLSGSRPSAVVLAGWRQRESAAGVAAQAAAPASKVDVVDAAASAVAAVGAEQDSFPSSEAPRNSSSSLQASADDVPRPHTPTTGVATPTDRSSGAVSVDHSASGVGSSSVPSSRSSYCIAMPRCGVAPSLGSARPASEGGYSWCSSCANDDMVAATAAAAAAAAVAAAGQPVSKDLERGRQPLLQTLRESCPGGGADGSDVSGPGSGTGSLADGRGSVSASDAGAVGKCLDGRHPSAGCKAAREVVVLTPPEGSGTSPLGRGCNGTAVQEQSLPLPPPSSPERQRAAAGSLSSSGAATALGASAEEAAQSEAAIVAAALTAAAAYRTTTLEAGPAEGSATAGGGCASSSAGALSTAEAVAAAWNVAAATTAASAAPAGLSRTTADGARDDGGRGIIISLGRPASPVLCDRDRSATQCTKPCNAEAPLDAMELGGAIVLIKPKPAIAGSIVSQPSDAPHQLPSAAAEAAAPTASRAMPLLPQPSPSSAVSAAVVSLAAVTLGAGSVSSSMAAMKRVGSAASDLARPCSHAGAGGGGGSGAGGGGRFFSGGGGGALPKRGGGRDRGGSLDWAAINPFFSLRRLSLLRLSDEDLAKLAGCVPLQGRLQSLSLADGSELSDAGMKAVARLRRLEHLSLRGLTRTFDAVVGSWTNLTELRALELGLAPAAAVALAVASDAAAAAADAAAAAIAAPTAIATVHPASHVSAGGEHGLGFGLSGTAAADGVAKCQGPERTSSVEHPAEGASSAKGAGGAGGFAWGQWPSPVGGAAADLAGLQAALRGSLSSGAAATAGRGSSSGDGDGGDQPLHQAHGDELDAAVAMVAAAGGFNSDADDTAAGGSTYAEAMYGSGSSRRSCDVDAVLCSDADPEPGVIHEGIFSGGDFGAGAADGDGRPPSLWLYAQESSGGGCGGGPGAASTANAGPASSLWHEVGFAAGDELDAQLGSAQGQKDFIPVFSERPLGRRYGSSNGLDDGWLTGLNAGAAAGAAAGCRARQGSPWPASPVCRAGGFSSAASADRAGWDLGVGSGTAVRWASPIALKDEDDGGAGLNDGRVHGARGGAAAVVAAAAAAAVAVAVAARGGASASADREEACTLTDNGLQLLLQRLPKLKELYLHNLPHLTPATLEQVLSRPGLRILSVDGCRNLTPDFCELLAISALDLTAAVEGDGTGGDSGEGAGLRLRLVPA